VTPYKGEDGMGIPVTDFSDFENKIKSIENKPSIMAFLLYSESPNQKTVATFVDQFSNFIDFQAREMKTYLFYPARKEGEVYRNPSPEICRIFHVNPIELPGLLLFSTAMQGDQFLVRQSAYLPLKPGDFSNFDLLEELFYSLANLVSPYLGQGVPVDMVALAERLKVIEGEQYFPRFLDFSRRAAIQVLNFSVTTLEKIVEKVVIEISKKVTGIP
jgi:hypothetical protein